MQLPPDFRDLLFEFNAASCEYVIVGAFAMGAHGMPRYTGDIDLFYRPTPENAIRILKALENFGYVSSDLTIESLLAPETVHYFGRPPLRIDLLNAISGVSFEQAWDSRVTVDINGLKVPVLGLDQLVANKRASGRAKDLADVEVLEKARKNSPPPGQ